MKKVLILGPQDIISKTIAAHCEENNATVDIIISGADAMSNLLVEKYDLIITPMFLEKVDAIQIIKAVKNSDSINSSTPKIMITSEKNVAQLFGKGEEPEFILTKDAEVLKSFESIFNQLFLQSNSNKKSRVLYVDDDKLVRKMVELWLRKIPEIELEICSSLAEVKNLKSEKFDIIATDHFLGDGLSEDVVEHLQSTVHKDSPILVYTATVGNVDFEKLKKLGNVIDVLPKPFKVKDFQLVLEKLK
jgi:CheY-like chemotaxis protein